LTKATIACPFKPPWSDPEAHPGPIIKAQNIQKD
jgi:hypothetical protein